MARSWQPSSAFSIASGRASSTKNSAGPPMPNEVRDASGSSSFIPDSPRSQVRLDFVRQVIAQLLDIAGAHEQQQVVGSDDLVQSLLRLDEVADVGRLADLMRQVFGPNMRRVLLARAVGVEDEHAVRPVEGAGEVMH